MRTLRDTPLPSKAPNRGTRRCGVCGRFATILTTDKRCPTCAPTLPADWPTNQTTTRTGRGGHRG
jgi:hypothetical protein